MRTARSSFRLLLALSGWLLLPNALAATAAEQATDEGAYLGLSARERLQHEAERRDLDARSLADVKSALADANPFFRARAAQELWARTELAALCVPELVALLALSKLPPGPDILEAFNLRLRDPDPEIRRFTVWTLCRHGHVPDAEEVREAWARPGWGALEVGAAGSWAWDSRSLVAALAPHADGRIFAILLERPVLPDEDPPGATLFEDLGRSLLRHPEAADVLLRATELRGLKFAEEVFRQAGRAMLPVLHEALRSADRVVRSNAARACGAIGDPSSIPPLLAALDFESGLSRASVVGALGRLKAREALPRLATLYADSLNDERRRRGASFRASQSGAWMAAQYESLSDLDALRAEWNELRRAAFAPPRDPREREALLSTRSVLAAVRAIGPAASQQFYRALAGSRDEGSRLEAAERLSECGPADAAGNTVVLRLLLADEREFVRVAAAVSLLVLTPDDVARASLLSWLEEGPRWPRMQAVRRLSRLSDPSRLAPLLPALRALAEDPKLFEDDRKAVRNLLSSPERGPEGPAPRTQEAAAGPVASR